MKFDSDKHHRRSIRLRGYDYARPGAYFVTICTQNRECLFGEVVDGCMHLNAIGDIVQLGWHDLPNHYRHIQLDGWVVMPNHVHGVIILTDTVTVGAGDVVGSGDVVGAGLKPAPTGICVDTDTGVGADMNTGSIPAKRHGLPEIVRGFKTFSSRRINRIRNTPGVPVWQRNYYERIVRDQRALDAIRQYILNNPQNWAKDAENL